MPNILNTMILFFVMVIIGIVFLTTTNQSVADQAVLTTVTDDQFIASNTSCVQVASGCIDSITNVENATGGAITFGASNYTICTTSTGSYDGILFNGDATIDAAYNGQTINATYVYSRGCLYVANSTARNLSSLIVIFLVLSLIGGGIYYLFQSGIMDNFGK